MTISVTTPVQQYAGTGAEPVLNTVFPFFVDADVVVTQRVTATGVDTLMVLGVHYMMTGGSSTGAVGTVTPISGSVNFTSAMTWTIERVIPLTQDLDYVENDTFPAESHEAGLDRLTMQSQDREQIFKRSLRFPVDDVTSLTSELPDSVTRASKALTFDSAGNVVVTTPASASGTTVTATGSTTPRTLAERWSQEINVKDYGAIGDGATDDTAAFNAAFAALRLELVTLPGTANFITAVLRIPPGDYRCNTTIDATEIRVSNWTIEASGSVIRGVHASGGNAVLDLYGSRFCTIKDMTIYGDETDTPAWGIQIGRSSATVAGNATFHDLTILGEFTKGCLYNYGSEIGNYYSCRMWNRHNSLTSYCMVNDGTNDFGVTSQFTTSASASTAVSFNHCIYWNCDFRKMVSGPAIYMKRTSGHAYFRSYAVSHDDSAVVIDSDSFGHRGLHLDIHFETSQGTGLKHAVEFKGNTNQTIRGLTLIDHSPDASVTIFRAEASLTMVTIENLNVDISDYTTVPTEGIFSPKTKFKVYGGNIYLGAGGTHPNIDEENTIVTLDDRDLGVYGPGTQLIFDKENTQIALKGELRVFDQSGTSVAAGALGNIGETRINGIGVAYKDGVTAPGTITGMASTYIDTADGFFKIKFADGTINLITTTPPIRTVASATTVAVTSVDRILSVTGSTKVDDFTGGTTGQTITVIWAAAATFDVDGTGAGIELSTGSDISAATADSTLTLVNDGTNWLEVGRSET